MKKIFSLVLGIFCIISMSNPINANHILMKNSIIESTKKELVWHDINELETISYDETFSRDEFIEILSENGYNSKQINELIGEKTIETKADTEIRYSLFKMNVFNYHNGFNGIISNYKLQARFSAGFEYYKGDYSPNKVVSLGGAHVYTGDGKSCVFKGSIYYKLISGNSFYYNFYGDIYEKGSMNWAIGATLKIGESSTLTANVSNADGFVKNVSEAETWKGAGLQP